MKQTMLGSLITAGGVLATLLFPSPATAKSYIVELTPAEQAAIQRSHALVNAGDAACLAGDYQEGEKDYKAAKAVMNDPYADRGLAEALLGEGRYSEAVETYRALLAPNPHVSSGTNNETRTQMGFAIALSRNGEWEEAVSVYEHEMPNTAHYGDAPKTEVHFSPYALRPAQLEAIAHVAIGTEYLGHSEIRKAFSEFTRAMQNDPKSAYSNYYYGYSWQRLSPEDQAKLGTVQQAKAALQKAEITGNADVKAAAAKALKALG